MEKTSTQKNLKKIKKVLDKRERAWYYVRAVRESGDVPCKLNNEKHEQTPWTILIKKQSCSEMNVNVKHCKKNSQRKFLSKAKSELKE